MNEIRHVSRKENKMKAVLGPLAVGIVTASLGGCGYLFGEDGYFRDRGSDYQLAAVEPRMTIPEGVDSKPLGDLLPVPGELQAQSEKFATPRPQPMQSGVGGNTFSVQQDGSRRWLEAQRTPAESWALVQQFLADYQVSVAHESQQLGEIHTGWLSFDKQSANPLVRRLIPAVSEGRRTEGQEQRLRLRIEPGIRSGTSEVHVLQMSRSEGSDLSEWPERSHDSKVESAALAELETYLNQSGETDAASLAASRISIAQRSELVRDGAGNPVLRIDADFNRAWAAVGAALERSEVFVSDLNRSSGVYYVDLAQTVSERENRGFFSRLFSRDQPEEEQAEPRIQVRLTEVGGEVQVSVDQGIETSADAELARDLLTRIRDNLS